MRGIRQLLAVTAQLCLAAVLLQWAILRFVGEAWWLSTVYLYVPFALLLAPLAAVSLALLVLGPRRLLWTQAAAALVVLFPTMGLTLSLPTAATPGTPRLRVLAEDVDSGQIFLPALVAETRSAQPDLVLLVESTAQVDEAVAAAFPGFATVTSKQYWLSAATWSSTSLSLPGST